MKKNLFYSVALCLLLFSCKKEEQTSAYTEVKSDAKKYAVNFNLSDFTQTVESMGAKGSNTIMSAGSAVKAIDSLKNHIRELRYILYDAAGTPIKTIRQGVNGGGTQFHCATCDSDFGHPDALPYNKPFGTIVDSLPAGNYKAVFLGIRDYNYNMNSRYTDETNWDVNFNSSWVGDNRTLDFQPLWTTGDVFHKSFSFTVGTVNVQQDVKLNRVIGKLDINIEDAIPANANKIDFRFDNAPTQFLLGSGVTSGGSWYGDRGDTLETNDYDDYTMWHAIQIKSSEKGMNNFLSSRVVFGSDRGFLVEIRCFDINNKIIARKYVQNVHVYANKRTLLTGKLFDNRQQAGFSVTVNSDWNPESEVVNF